jgi:N-acetylglutamate synthase-like GNAT family acetyltransferase
MGIRDARPEEVASLSALAMRSKAHWGYDDHFMAACREELTVAPEDFGQVWVCEHDGEVAGFYTLLVENGVAEVEHLFVAPEHIGHGHGRALWADLMDRAARRGADEVRVTSDPHAEAFYRRMGCAPVGVEASASIPGRDLPRLALKIRAAATA